MSEALDRLRSSMADDHGVFREDYDLGAALALTGDDREDALDEIVRVLDQGMDARAPRCLAAMGAKERTTELRVAADTAQPSVRAESAIAVWKLEADRPLVLRVLGDVLKDPRSTTVPKVRALIGLEAVGGDDAVAVIRLALDDADANVRANAFTSLLRASGAQAWRKRHNRVHALQMIAACAFPSVRAAVAPRIDELLADYRAGNAAPWQETAAVGEPGFEDLRKRLEHGAPAGPMPALTSADVAGRPRADVELLQAWAVVLLENEHPNAATLVQELAVPGANGLASAAP